MKLHKLKSQKMATKNNCEAIAKRISNIMRAQTLYMYLFEAI